MYKTYITAAVHKVKTVQDMYQNCCTQSQDCRGVQYIYITAAVHEVKTVQDMY